MKIFTLLFLGLSLLVSCDNSNEKDRQKNDLENSIDLNKYKRIQMQQENSNPEYLYKVVSPQQWKQSQLQNAIVLLPMDEDFIHLATKEQLPRITQKFWGNEDYLILKLASKKLRGRLVYEANPGGSTRYYHLYEGKIPLDAVVEVSHEKS